ncbi:uncharacterized protein LOC135925786 isoform X2 [Gordionus sp. m RMFG-2023]|uniref:uncharacterized protein LOC135925757 isoform X2 n=1 Tax=Gordionus sp. m RMFG-2023 TaxID=3053472 RepID=UPI0031FC15C1
MIPSHFRKYDSYNTTMYYKCTRPSCAGKGVFKNNTFQKSKQCTAPACLEITQVKSIATQTDPINVDSISVATQTFETITNQGKLYNILLICYLVNLEIVFLASNNMIPPTNQTSNNMIPPTNQASNNMIPPTNQTSNNMIPPTNQTSNNMIPPTNQSIEDYSYKFIKSKFNNNLIYSNKYLYHRNRGFFYKCRLQSCKGRGILGTHFMMTKQHNHDNDEVYYELLLTLNELKNQTKLNKYLSLHKIYKKVMRERKLDSFAMRHPKTLPTFLSVKTIMARVIQSTRPFLPRTNADIALLEEH